MAWLLYQGWKCEHVNTLANLGINRLQDWLYQGFYLASFTRVHTIVISRWFLITNFTWRQDGFWWRLWVTFSSAFPFVLYIKYKICNGISYVYMVTYLMMIAYSHLCLSFNHRKRKRAHRGRWLFTVPVIVWQTKPNLMLIYTSYIQSSVKKWKKDDFLGWSHTLSHSSGRQCHWYMHKIPWSVTSKTYRRTDACTHTQTKGVRGLTTLSQASPQHHTS